MRIIYYIPGDKTLRSHRFLIPFGKMPDLNWLSILDTRWYACTGTYFLSDKRLKQGEYFETRIYNLILDSFLSLFLFFSVSLGLFLLVLSLMLVRENLCMHRGATRSSTATLPRVVIFAVHRNLCRQGATMTGCVFVHETCTMSSRQSHRVRDIDQYKTVSASYAITSRSA